MSEEIKKFNERKHSLELVTCKHFRGIREGTCEAGIETKAVARGTVPYSIACIRNTPWQIGGCPQCPSFTAQTAEEVDARERAFAQAVVDTFVHNKSPCCKAPIDERRVIEKGRHKGHGKRVCSKCGRVAYLV